MDCSASSADIPIVSIHPLCNVEPGCHPPQSKYWQNPSLWIQTKTDISCACDESVFLSVIFVGSWCSVLAIRPHRLSRHRMIKSDDHFLEIHRRYCHYNSRFRFLSVFNLSFRVFLSVPAIILLSLMPFRKSYFHYRPATDMWRRKNE